MFDVRTTGDTAHINMSTCWRVCGNNLNIISMCAVSPVVHTSNISSCQKKLFQFSCGCEKFHYHRSFGFLVINVCNHGEHYEMPCIYVASYCIVIVKYQAVFIKYYDCLYICFNYLTFTSHPCGAILYSERQIYFLELSHKQRDVNVNICTSSRKVSYFCHILK